MKPTHNIGGGGGLVIWRGDEYILSFLFGEFVSSQPAKYKKYLDKKKSEEDFNRLIEQGIIVNPDVSPSTTLYFFKSALTKPEATEKKNAKAWWKFW